MNPVPLLVDFNQSPPTAHEIYHLRHRAASEIGRCDKKRSAITTVTMIFFVLSFSVPGILALENNNLQNSIDGFGAAIMFSALVFFALFLLSIIIDTKFFGEKLASKKEAWIKVKNSTEFYALYSEKDIPIIKSLEQAVSDNEHIQVYVKQVKGRKLLHIEAVEILKESKSSKDISDLDLKSMIVGTETYL